VRLVLTGGGTGGHIYPAIAIAQACAQEPSLQPLDVVFVGTRHGLEADIVPAAGLRAAFVRAKPLDRRISFGLIATVYANLIGFLQALVIFHRVRPDVVVATGGYVAFPVVAALRCVRTLHITRAKIALLEANVTAGLTNRLLAPLADEIWYANAPGRALRAREMVTGMPVRAALRVPMDVETARQTLRLGRHLTTIVAMGGSQGARSINEAIAGLAERGMPADWQIALVTGSRDFQRLAQRLDGLRGIRVLAYLDDPRAAYAAADIMVTRSGASTLAELAASRTPAILVPYPHATGDHQMHNARAYAAGGGAVVVADAELDATRLRAELAAALAADVLQRLRAAVQAAATVDPTATIVARVKRLSSTNPSVP